jgi:hypothetical protein
MTLAFSKAPTVTVGLANLTPTTSRDERTVLAGSWDFEVKEIEVFEIAD